MSHIAEPAANSCPVRGHAKNARHHQSKEIETIGAANANQCGLQKDFCRTAHPLAFKSLVELRKLRPRTDFDHCFWQPLLDQRSLEQTSLYANLLRTFLGKIPFRGSEEWPNRNSS